MAFKSIHVSKVGPRAGSGQPDVGKPRIEVKSTAPGAVVSC